MRGCYGLGVGWSFFLMVCADVYQDMRPLSDRTLSLQAVFFRSDHDITDVSGTGFISEPVNTLFMS